MTKKLPKFEYVPDPIKAGMMEESKGICDCCNENHYYICLGGIYSKHDDVINLCPWCVFSGKASKKYDGHFNMVDIDKNSMEPVVDEQGKTTGFRTIEGYQKPIGNDEIESRTPSIVGYQEQDWRHHCGECCDFHGRAIGNDFKNLSQSSKEILQENSYIDDESEIEELQDFGMQEIPYFIKFICRHCDTILLIYDPN